MNNFDIVHQLSCVPGTRNLRDSEDDLEDTSCWLKASHLFFSSIVLMVASFSLLVATYYDDNVIRLRAPAAGILALSIVSALASGLCYMFIELRVQDRNVHCRRLHDCLCCTKSDSSEVVALESVCIYKSQSQYKAPARCHSADCCNQDVSPRNVM